MTLTVKDTALCELYKLEREIFSLRNIYNYIQVTQR